MATVQRYVNTASSAGGDGTTNGTSGSNRAYASLSEWEANSGGSATDDYVVDCCGSTADSAGAVTVNFATDITTGSVLIRGNRGEADGFYDGDVVISSSHYRLAPGNVTGALLLQETRTTVDGIQVSAGHSSSFGIGISLGANTLTVRKCRVHDANSTDYGIGRAGSSYTNSGTTWTIENNLVVGFDVDQINTQINPAFNHTHNIYHNTCYGGTRGIQFYGDSGDTIRVKGNAIAGTSSSDIVNSMASGSPTYDANATDDYDLGTTGEIDLGTLSSAWTSHGTSTSSNFTVTDASSPLNATVTGSLVSDDIRDATRSNYSVGCFEFESGVNLSIADATHGHTADGLALTQDHQLVVQDASHSHAADNLSLTQDHQLAVADATHGHVADNVVLSTAIALSVADALHGHSADNITLVQQNVLVVADATHGHSVDNVVLSAGTNLAVADAAHGHMVDSLALTQQHVLIVADALHVHAVDSVVLVDPNAVVVDLGGGGPDRSDEEPAERYTNDASGWRKPQWVRERERKSPVPAVVSPVPRQELQEAEPVSSVVPAGLPTAPRTARKPISEAPAADDQIVSSTTLADIERARIAAKVRQAREMEEIMTVLMMAA